MVRGIEGNEMSTPRATKADNPPSSSQLEKNQRSILGFFQRKSDVGSSPSSAAVNRIRAATLHLLRAATLRNLHLQLKISKGLQICKLMIRRRKRLMVWVGVTFRERLEFIDAV
jgi:hypothetical protein